MAKTLPYRAYCDARVAQMRFRTLKSATLKPDGRIERDGRILVNFAANDYLGLSQHPALIAAACEFAQNFGAGVAASRLVTGDHPAFSLIEARLAGAKGQKAALALSGGYQTNLTAVAALADPEILGKPCVLADRLAHHSILQGAQLSGARLMRFRHNDHEHLENLLRQRTEKGEFCVIVTESVFGMDGDLADLGVLSALSERYGALLYVDEAHATGVFGARGFGVCEDFGEKIDVAMGTFGKALGSFGSYLACNQDLRDFLVQRCGGLVYSTGLTPANLGAMSAALDLIPTLGPERRKLLALAARLRENLRQRGWDCGASQSQIVPVLIGGEAETLAHAARLEDLGFLVGAIRPPTVPHGSSRLRVSLSAVHHDEDIDGFCAALGDNEAAS